MGGMWPFLDCARRTLYPSTRISTDICFWGNGTYGTTKAVNVRARGYVYNGSYSHAGSWLDPDLLFSANPVGGDNEPMKCKGPGS